MRWITEDCRSFGFAGWHADAMTEEEIHKKLGKGYDDIAARRVQNAAEAFAKFRENH